MIGVRSWEGKLFRASGMNLKSLSTLPIQHRIRQYYWWLVLKEKQEEIRMLKTRLIIPNFLKLKNLSAKINFTKNSI